MNQRGVALAFVLITSLILGLIASYALEWALGARLVQARSQLRTRALGLLEAARAQATACLYETGYPSGSCTPSPSQRACLPASVGGAEVRVTLAGALPNCDLRLDLELEP